jgi:C4-dicarboxylate transporter/malic acid transport protein
MTVNTPVQTVQSKLEIIRNFAPGWFASVMGTAVFVIELFVFQDIIPLAQTWQLLFLGLSFAMFVAILIPWTLRWFHHFDQVRHDLTHPVSAAFFPTMPISLIVGGIALEKAGPLFMSHETLFPILQGLWLVGTTGIGIFALTILSIYFLKPDMEWQIANLGWLIPPVSALIVPVLGGSLATEYAGTTLGAINLIGSLIFLGIGAVLFLFVMGAVFSRYLFHDLLPAHLAPTIWIGIAPTAILTIIIIKIVKPVTLFFNAPAEAAPILSVMAKSLGVGLWGFAFFWLILAVFLTWRHHKKVALPFAMSWWAFTFPLGAFVVSTGVIFQATQAGFFQWVGLAALLGYVVIWGIVATRTVKGILSGAIFQTHT